MFELEFIIVYSKITFHLLLANSLANRMAEKANPANARLCAFYDSIHLPTHVRNLLNIYGVEEVEHLLNFDGSTIGRIEEAVRAGTFLKGFIMLSSKQDQKRYFGAPIIDLSEFSFRMGVSDILHALSGEARKLLDKEEEERAAQVSKKRRRVRRLSFSSSSDSFSQPYYSRGAGSETQRYCVA